jgi:hypothetical protein
MEAWSGEASELNDGRRERRKGGVCGEVAKVSEGILLGVEVRERRGWWAWYGNDPSRLCRGWRLGVGPLDGGGKAKGEEATAA